MRELWTDNRGQAIQIGAVLLFAVLVVSFSYYQAYGVPEENKRVEFNHNDRVQRQMQDLRSNIISLNRNSDTAATTIYLGTQYPSRLVAVNPAPPSGTLRTAETTDTTVNLTIRNASVAGEAGDYWNETRVFNTGNLVYSPNYNEYIEAPETIYDNTVLYNQFRSGTTTEANQTFIDGTDISLVVLNGSLSRSASSATTIQIDAASSSTETIEMFDDTSSGPLTVEFVSKRSAEYWTFLENTQSSVDTVTDASTPAPSGYHTIAVKLDETESYTVEITKVGVGTRISEDNTAYLTDIEGDGETVTQGQRTELTLAVRDQFGNPPDNSTKTTIEGGVVGDGELDVDSKTPDSAGEVSFTYTAPSSSTGTQQINFNYVGLDGTFDGTTNQNVTVTVDVQASGSGSGSPFTVSWERPDFTEYINNSAMGELKQSNFRGIPVLMQVTDDGTAISQVSVSYGVNNATNVTTSFNQGVTNESGYNETRVRHSSDGRSRVYALVGGSSDEVNLVVDRLLNESFEDDAQTLESNGWIYEDNNNNGDGGVESESGAPDAPVGDKYAYINGTGCPCPSQSGSDSGTRAIRMNYSIDTQDYEALTLTYIAREPYGGDNPDPSNDDPDSNSPSENLSVEYKDSTGSWVEVDNVSAGGDTDSPISHYRRVRIESIDNASHQDFRLRFTQGKTSFGDTWQIDGIELVGLNTSKVSEVNQKPKAHFRYSPENPNTGQDVTFWANRSDDPDGDDFLGNSEYLDYKWDWDGDGTYEGANEQTTHSFSSGGTKEVTLQVTDDRGKTATSTQNITVSGG